MTILSIQFDQALDKRLEFLAQITAASVDHESRRRSRGQRTLTVFVFRFLFVFRRRRRRGSGGGCRRRRTSRRSIVVVRLVLVFVTFQQFQPQIDRFVRSKRSTVDGLVVVAARFDQRRGVVVVATERYRTVHIVGSSIYLYIYV